ncbi:MAG: hypothetical protein NTZ17_12395 [Phycisphaerae bacterium]|nr:hypothetical protein [Phycisphaerae bacterium]
MELTWINKLRIAAVAALGIVVIGLSAWPLAAPADPLSPVRAWSISPFGTMTLLILAFGLGFAGYFIAWPHGREIGILAVPFGLLVWAGRSGPMRVLTQASNQPSEREALVSSLRFEPIYWLLIVAAGFAGVLFAQRLRGLAREEGKNEERSQALFLLPACFAVAATVLLAHFFVGVFAQDVATSHNVAATQPRIGQIIFAVISAFAIAAFLIKKFTNLSYIWPAIGSVLITGFAQVVYGNAQAVRQFAETRPATFFPHSALTILPVQFVVLGTLGSILGYWMAVRYDWWRKHESGV